MAKRTTITDAVTVLAESFGGRASDTMFEGYYIALKDFTDDQVGAAMAAALREPREFMPKPGELRQLAATHGAGLESACDAAWLVLSEAIRRHGADKSVNFRDALINATVRIRGGWQRVCGIEAEEFEKWFRKEFNSAYAMLLANNPAPDLLGYLPGNLERVNAHWVGKPYGGGNNIFKLPPPEEVGCDYKPLVLSAPGVFQALPARPKSIPQLEMKTVK